MCIRDRCLASVVTRSGKGSPLSNTEMDANLTNLNRDKAELSGATFTGAITANSGISVDNITIDGTEIDLSSGDFTLDVAGDIKLDAGGSDIRLEVSGTQSGKFTRSSGDFIISSSENDKDMKFAGADGGSDITALTLDMSDAGAATFNSHIKLNDDKQITWGDGTVSIQGDAANEELSIGVNNVAALTFYSSEAVFNEGSSNIDSRVESDGNNHMLFVDGGENAVAVGSSTVDRGLFHVNHVNNGYFLTTHT